VCECMCVCFCVSSLIAAGFFIVDVVCVCVCAHECVCACVRACVWLSFKQAAGCLFACRSVGGVLSVHLCNAVCSPHHGFKVPQITNNPFELHPTLCTRLSSYCTYMYSEYLNLKQCILKKLFDHRHPQHPVKIPARSGAVRKIIFQKTSLTPKVVI
jgi:hypothetical protein